LEAQITHRKALFEIKEENIMTKLNTYLNFAGNAEEAFNFYESVFSGQFTSVVRFKDMPMEGVKIPREDENKIMHIGLRIGNEDVLMASDSLESLGQKLVQGNNVYISVHPDSKEEADRIFKALSAGGEVEMSLTDQPWGDYWGAFKDKFGVQWMVNYSKQWMVNYSKPKDK
jgi:PhnB protein